MLKNVPSDKMDDPAVESIGINTLFCKAALTRKQENIAFSLHGFLQFEKLSIVAKKKKKNQLCVYFQHCSVLGTLRPSSLCIHDLLLLFCTISIPCRRENA